MVVTSSRTLRKLLLAFVLAAAGVLLRPSDALAYCPYADYSTCENACDYQWTWCRWDCTGYPPEYYYVCTDQCDTQYWSCVDWCLGHCPPGP